VLRVLLGIAIGVFIYANPEARQITADLLRAAGDAPALGRAGAALAHLPVAAAGRGGAHVDPGDQRRVRPAHAAGPTAGPKARALSAPFAARITLPISPLAILRAGPRAVPMSTP